MSADFIGAKISLTSKSDIRYLGTLQAIDQAASTITLTQVVSMGTEDRRPEGRIPATTNVYEVVVFRAADVKDLSVEEVAPKVAPTQPLQDPAIMSQSSVPGPSPTLFQSQPQQPSQPQHQRDVPPHLLAQQQTPHFQQQWPPQPPHLWQQQQQPAPYSMPTGPFPGQQQQQQHPPRGGPAPQATSVPSPIVPPQQAAAAPSQPIERTTSTTSHASSGPSSTQSPREQPSQPQSQPPQPPIQQRKSYESDTVSSIEKVQAAITEARAPGPSSVPHSHSVFEGPAATNRSRRGGGGGGGGPRAGSGHGPSSTHFGQAQAQAIAASDEAFDFEQMNKKFEQMRSQENERKQVRRDSHTSQQEKGRSTSAGGVVVEEDEDDDNSDVEEQDNVAHANANGNGKVEEEKPAYNKSSSFFDSVSSDVSHPKGPNGRGRGGRGHRGGADFGGAGRGGSRQIGAGGGGMHWSRSDQAIANMNTFGELGGSAYGVRGGGPGDGYRGRGRPRGRGGNTNGPTQRSPVFQ